ncbi:MAG: dihydrofolate reductase family protein, partial [Salibacteraceae bacterium]
MKCSVYIATSVDGFIAKKDGSVDWLHIAGNPEAEMGENADMGMNAFMASIDCMVMGRKTMDIIASMNLTPEQWFYGDIKIKVLSNSVKEPPASLKGKVEMYSGGILELISELESQGYKHAYIDGGTTIRTFLDLKLINEMTLTRVPTILGEGIPLFGESKYTIKLEQAKATAFPNDFVQINYQVSY